MIDNFETAVRRAGSDCGYVVAFSFTRGAREEAARARWQDKLNIELITIKQLLNPEIHQRLALLSGVLATVIDLPLPAARSQQARPKAEELIKSSREAI